VGRERAEIARESGVLTRTGVNMCPVSRAFRLIAKGRPRLRTSSRISDPPRGLSEQAARKTRREKTIGYGVTRRVWRARCRTDANMGDVAGSGTETTRGYTVRAPAGGEMITSLDVIGEKAPGAPLVLIPPLPEPDRSDP
jgi:hypothetical protein